MSIDQRALLLIKRSFEAIVTRFWCFVIPKHLKVTASDFIFTGANDYYISFDAYLISLHPTFLLLSGSL